MQTLKDLAKFNILNQVFFVHFKFQDQGWASMSNAEHKVTSALSANFATLSVAGMWNLVSTFVVIGGVSVVLFLLWYQGNYRMLGIGLLILVVGSLIFRNSIVPIESKFSKANHKQDWVRQFADSMDEGLLITDRTGRIFYANQAYANLSNAVDVRSVSSLGRILSGYPETEGAMFRLSQAVRENRSTDEEISLSRPLDDSSEESCLYKISVFPLSVSLEPSHQSNGLTAWRVVEVDRRQKIEAQTTQNQKMQAIGHLAGGVAHDFNNILTAIIGATDFLLAKHRDTDPAFQDIMSIKHNANRATALVRQLLAFSRRQTLVPSELNLNEVLADMTHMLDRLLGEKVKLKFFPGKDLWPVQADPTQFDQVMLNLAVNANDAMPKGGELSIRTSNLPTNSIRDFKGGEGVPQADYVVVEVSDNGAGMPQDVVEKAFDPFFTTKGVGEGTGLGLSTVYGIVNQTGGYIIPESEADVGTTFRIFLPRFRSTEKDTGSEVIQEAAPTVDLTGNECILLVEDEDSVRTFASRALISRGYEVHEATTGTEALEVINSIERQVDLVVSDVVMPEMDGPTLLGELRKIRPDIKVIFVSGYAEDAFEKNLPNNEEFTFLPKPFSLKELATTVKQVLSTS